MGGNRQGTENESFKSPVTLLQSERQAMKAPVSVSLSSWLPLVAECESRIEDSHR